MTSTKILACGAFVHALCFGVISFVVLIESIKFFTSEQIEGNKNKKSIAFYFIFLTFIFCLSASVATTSLNKSNKLNNQFEKERTVFTEKTYKTTSSDLSEILIDKDEKEITFKYIKDKGYLVKNVKTIKINNKKDLNTFENELNKILFDLKDQNIITGNDENINNGVNDYYNEDGNSNESNYAVSSIEYEIKYKINKAEKIKDLKILKVQYDLEENNN